MAILVVAMLLCIVAGITIVGYVAVQARREGRQIWTPQGEQLMHDARRRGEHLRERTEQVTRRSRETSSHSK